MKQLVYSLVKMLRSAKHPVAERQWIENERYRLEKEAILKNARQRKCEAEQLTRTVRPSNNLEWATARQTIDIEGTIG